MANRYLVWVKKVTRKSYGQSLSNDLCVIGKYNVTWASPSCWPILNFGSRMRSLVVLTLVLLQQRGAFDAPLTAG